jgi:hypothetical protein
MAIKYSKFQCNFFTWYLSFLGIAEKFRDIKANKKGKIQKKIFLLEISQSNMQSRHIEKKVKKFSCCSRSKHNLKYEELFLE